MCDCGLLIMRDDMVPCPVTGREPCGEVAAWLLRRSKRGGNHGLVGIAAQGKARWKRLVGGMRRPWYGLRSMAPLAFASRPLICVTRRRGPPLTPRMNLAVKFVRSVCGALTVCFRYDRLAPPDGVSCHLASLLTSCQGTERKKGCAADFVFSPLTITQKH